MLFKGIVDFKCRVINTCLQSLTNKSETTCEWRVQESICKQCRKRFNKVVVAPTVHEVRMCNNGKTYILIMPKMHYKIILITTVIVVKL